MGFLNHRGGRKKEDATDFSFKESGLCSIEATSFKICLWSYPNLLLKLFFAWSSLHLHFISFNCHWLLQVGPLVQTCNFAVMTGVNAGISCVMKRLRGKEDVETRSGVMFSLVIDMEFRRSSPPHTKNFSYMTDNTYTKQEVVKMEADLLKALKYEMGNPTAKSFLRKITIVAQEDYHLLNNASVVIVDLAFWASVVFLSRFTLKPTSHPWNLTLEQHS